MIEKWAFSTLARADNTTLEMALRASQAPDPTRLVGYGYDGYNCNWLGQLVDTKFRKLFYRDAQGVHGFNQLIEQDDQGYEGQWQVRVRDGRVQTRGYFKVAPVGEGNTPGSLLAPYGHLLGFDYDVPQNGRDLLARTIYDVIGLPNEGEYDVVLGKAYLRLPAGLILFATYFILGRPQPDRGHSL